MMTRAEDDRRAATAVNRMHITVAMFAALASMVSSIATVFVALSAVEKVSTVKDEVKVVTTKVEEIKKATDGMKDALVQATRQEALIEGHAEGKKQGVELGVASEKSRAVRAKENKAIGAAEEKNKPFWKK